MLAAHARARAAPPAAGALATLEAIRAALAQARAAQLVALKRPRTQQTAVLKLARAAPAAEPTLARAARKAVLEQVRAQRPALLEQATARVLSRGCGQRWPAALARASLPPRKATRKHR